MTRSYLIHIDGESVADANLLAGRFQDILRDADPKVVVTRKSSDSSHLDAGATLGIILGSGAVLTVAKGIRDFLSRNRRANLRIVRPDGTVVVVANLPGGNVLPVVEAVLRDGFSGSES